jgi:threonine synthase
MSGSAPALGERWASRLVCSRTGVTARLDAPAFLSPAGAPWLVEYQLDPTRGEAWRRSLAGRGWSLWRYRELLPVADPDRRVDLGEGATPLVPLRRRRAGAPEVWIKDESGNPTGSFKARGLAVAVTRARELGAEGVGLASAGNAALALCAYAAAAGLPARVALPDPTPRIVEARCREYGAEVIRGGGTLVEAAALLHPAGRGWWDLSTLREPYRAEGKKTMGLELVEQLGWRLPEWIVYPTGGGTGIVGMDKAFRELRELGLLGGGERCRFVGVQMEGCAPLVRAFRSGRPEASPWERPDTAVWGLRVPRAIGDFLVLRALRESGGEALAVPEAAVPETTARVAREEGLLVGPEGAAALAAVDRLVAAGRMAPGEQVVVFQTGHPDNYR